jgi:diguanylate cyclase
VDAVAYQDFETASREMLEFLHQRLGFELWMVTRTQGNDWIVLQSEDHGYGVKPGTVFNWADSFCSHMVKNKGPRVAPSSDKVPLYAAAPIAKQVPIKAYIGVPLVKSDGTLSGTLCAMDPTSQPNSIAQEQGLVEMCGNLLSTILQLELKANDEARRAERLEVEALVDPLTRLYNRRGWDRLLLAEEERCRRHGSPASVVVIDLNDMKRVNDTKGHAAGDEYLVRAGTVLRQIARTTDVVARLGGDEFGILSVECDRAGGEVMMQRLRAGLDQAQVKASMGLAVRNPANGGLKLAWTTADENMYEEKRAQDAGGTAHEVRTH